MARGKKEQNRSGQTKTGARGVVWILRIAAVLALVLFLLPHGIRLTLQSWLAERGAVEKRIENVDFNPFTGRLAVFDLAARGAEGDRVSCRRFVLNFDWLPLVKKRLELVELQVRGLEFDARRLDDGTWRLGGLTLPDKPEKPEEEDKSEWHWGVGAAHLRDVAVDLHTPEIDERFALGHLRLANIYSWEGLDATPFRLEMSAFGGELLLEGSGRPFSTPVSVEADLQIEGMALETIGPFVETPLSGVLSLDTKVLAAKGADETDPLEIEVQGDAGIGGLDIEIGDLRLAGRQFDWTGAFRFVDDGEPPWTLDGDLAAETVVLDDPGRELNMARTSGLSVAGVHLEPDDVTIDAARIFALEAFERPPGAPAENGGQGLPLENASHLLAAQGLELGPMRFNDEVVLFERAVLKGAEILLVRRAGPGMEVSVWLDDNDEEAEEEVHEKAEEEVDEKENGKLKIDDLQLNESRVLFVDRMISSTFSLDARPLKLRIENLDRSAPDENISVVLESEIDDYAALHLEGTARPFGDALDMDFTGTIDSFNLASLSPYAVRYLDYRLKQGHLDVSLDWRIEDWQLVAENDLKISKLRVESLKKDRKTRLTELLGLRASTALSLLRDRQDNIEIELPLKGDLRDPEFEFDRVIVEAVRKSVQKTAVFYYAPMGLTLLTGIPFPPGSLTIADRVIDWVTSVKFEPVPFEPGSSELNEEARRHLKKIVDSLEEKEDLRIVLCGRVGAADLGETPPPKPWSEEVRQQQLDLARKRAVAVKDALVAGGIGADRLFLCQPRVGEKENEEPRVDVYL